MLNSTTWHIKQDGSGNFTTIQEGINASVHSDTVLVYPDRYYENVSFNGKNITVASLELITGDESYIATTIIDGNQQGSCVRLTNNENEAVLRGFSITNGQGDIIYGDIDKLGGGILISTPFQTNPINASIINCKIFNNYAVVGGGIYIDNANVTFSGLSIYDNSACGGGGILIIDESNVLFDQDNLCNLYNNFAGHALDILVSDAVNDIEVIVDTFTVQDQYDYFAQYNHTIPSTGEITVYVQNYYLERVNHDLYVSPNGNDDNSGFSPTEPMKTIAIALQKIISDSLDPKTVHVSSGIYSRDLNDQIFPLGGKNFVNLIGEDIESTILHNDYNESSFQMAERSYCNLKNFTFTSSGQLMHDVIGIYKSNHFQLENLSIEGNNLCRNYSVDLYRCYDVIINRLNVLNNISEEASGFRFDGGNVIIKNSIFDNNDSIGPDQFVSNFYCQVDDYLELENCIFSNSDIPPFPDEEYYTVQISAQQNCYPDIKISNCLFANNSTTNGNYIAFISSPGSVEVNNCTFTQNTSHICPLGIFGDIDFRNNILYNNESDYEYEINTGNWPTIPSVLNVEYCDIEGGETAIYPGNPPNEAIINWLDGNIDGDPLFLLSGDDTFQLSELSPCIDTGTPDTNGLFLPPWDLLHNERIWDGDENGTAIIDMGCYEFGAEPVGAINVPSPIIDYQLSNYPNPFNPETTIIFNLPEGSKSKLTIYNIKGQRVKDITVTLSVVEELGKNKSATPCPSTSLRMTQAGSRQYSVVWDGTNQNNQPVSSGIYLYQLKVNGEAIASKKCLLLK